MVAVASIAELRDRLLAEKAKRRLRDFIPLAWEVLEPGTDYRSNWHIDAMCEHLEAVSRREIKRLVINVPPGYSKSRTVTAAWPCWEWIRSPQTRFMCWSYSQRLSTKHSIERRLVIESAWFKRHWGDSFRLADDDNQKTQFTNDKRGHMIATSRDGASTGDGGEILIIDDPLNPQQAASATELQNTAEWFKTTVPSRLRDKKEGAIVVVMQRLHEKDTTALALEQGYEHLMIPAEYDPGRSRVTSIGWKDPREKAGELLWPDFEGPAEIDAMKRALGSYGYSGQYQQSPHPTDGGIFKRDWLRTIARHLVPAGGFRFATVDLATSTKTAADFTVIMSWVFHDNALYLIDVHRDRLEGPDISPAIRRAIDTHGLHAAYVERAGMQLALVQFARREGLPIREITPDKDKVSRAMAATPRLEGGQVLIVDGAPWLGDLEGELLSFPNGAHDDQVDAFVYGVLVAPWRGQSVIQPATQETSSAARDALQAMSLLGGRR